jgi:capsular exopolysaccharide synthesis family protein
MDTESARVTQDTVAALAASTLQLDKHSPSTLANLVSGVSVSIPTNTTNLEIACTDATPEKAQLCAAAFADAYITDRISEAKAAYSVAQDAVYAKIAKANELIRQLVEDKRNAPTEDQADIQRQIREQQSLINAAQEAALALPTASPTAAVLARSADLPVKPSNKNYILTGVAAAVVGLAVGIGGVWLQDRLNGRITGENQIESALDAPVLAVIPHDKDWYNKREPRLITLSEPRSPMSEAYKSAGPVLLDIAGRNSLQVLIVSGPGQGEGKTTVVSNLSVVLAKNGKQVASVSCDLRKPRLHDFFGISNQIGLSDVLTGAAQLEETVEKTAVDGLFIIPSGPEPEDPTELLGSERMKGYLQELGRRYDFVLLDTPPALVVTDVLALASFADGIILVADAKTALAAETRLRHQLERAGGKVVGSVLNNVDPKSLGQYSAYRGSYGSNDSAATVPPQPSPDEAADEDEERPAYSGLGPPDPNQDDPAQ